MAVPNLLPSKTSLVEILGRSINVFRPNDPITREEAAQAITTLLTILAKALLAGTISPFVIQFFKQHVFVKVKHWFWKWLLSLDRIADSRRDHLVESGDICKLAGDGCRLFAVYRSIKRHMGILPMVLENHVRAVFFGENNTDRLEKRRILS